jgi:hypothetical protein
MVRTKRTAQSRFGALAAAAFIVVGAAATPASAQDVTHRSYTFLDHTLAIEVLGESPGVLHVVRGGPGRLEITARSDGGFPGFTIAGASRDRLRLTAVGARRAEYMVVIPEHVQLQVRLPGRHAERMPGGRFMTYEWGGEAAVAGGAAGSATAAPGGVKPRTGEAFTPPPTRWAERAPPQLNIGSLEGVQSVEVRVAGTRFGLTSPFPIERRGGSAEHAELRTAGAGEHILVIVPAGTESFTLSGAGEVMLSVRNGAAESGCGPVTVQRLPGEQRFTFAPVTLLRCRD